MHEQIFKKFERKKRRNAELIDPVRYIQNLFGGKGYNYIPIKTKESCDGTYIEYVSDGDTYLKKLSLKKDPNKMRKHITDIIEEWKSTDLCWKCIYY